MNVLSNTINKGPRELHRINVNLVGLRTSEECDFGTWHCHYALTKHLLGTLLSTLGAPLRKMGKSSFEYLSKPAGRDLPVAIDISISFKGPVP